ncbi:MAG: hypothetical protein MI746_08850 [Pseudomonadales bacterium]|nr:hypothetical protein [Pseudomonadales bacterium]
MSKTTSNLLFILPLFLISNTGSAQESHNFFEAPHHLSVLLGDTHIDGEGDNATIGIDYEYRISELTGLGFVLEHAFGDLEATTLLAVADIHLHEGWVMQIGPGYEWEEEEDTFVGRIGILYEFEWENGFTLSPQLHWDYHDGSHNAFVAGFALGFAF